MSNNVEIKYLREDGTIEPGDYHFVLLKDGEPFKLDDGSNFVSLGHTIKEGLDIKTLTQEIEADLAAFSKSCHTFVRLAPRDLWAVELRQAGDLNEEPTEATGDDRGGSEGSSNPAPIGEAELVQGHSGSPGDPAREATSTPDAGGSGDTEEGSS